MLDLVEEIVRTTPGNYYDRGLHAKFKRIDERWGLKFYDDKYMRDDTYELQSRAYEIGCAPMLGDKSDLKTPSGDTVYGYITECVVKLGKEIYNDQMGKDRGWCVCDYEMETIDGYSELVDKLNKIMDVEDFHGGNVGVLADGRMVAIDFSCCNF